MSDGELNLIQHVAETSSDMSAKKAVELMLDHINKHPVVCLNQKLIDELQLILPDLREFTDLWKKTKARARAAFWGTIGFVIVSIFVMGAIEYVKRLIKP